MDRRYKKIDTVHVHQGTKNGPLLDTFRQRPYAKDGWDYYLYEGGIFAGHVDKDKTKEYVYILVGEPSCSA